MIFDGNNSMLNGGFALTLIVYALFSAFISGPEILARESHKVNWQNQCISIVQAELKSSQSEPEYVPQLDYRSMARGWFGQDAEPLLKLMEPLGQAMDQAQAQADRVKRLNDERLRLKVQAAGSACNCAISILSEKRIALGLYAATGRLVTPPLFKNLSSELKTALNAHQCAISFQN